MKLKQIIFTSIITIIVTIISGVAVNWYTKNNIENDSKDNLYYRIVDISEFKSDSTKLSIISIEILNKNKEKYTNVELSVEFNKDSKIIDIISKNDVTNKTYNPVKRTKNNLVFNYPVFFPNEKIKINIAVSDLNSITNIALISNESLGKKFIPELEKEKINLTTIYIQIIILSIILLVTIFFLFKRLRILLGFFSNSLNNTAFLFLHSKQYDIAEKLLLNRIEKNGATSFELSNLATAEFLVNRNLDKAKSLFKMSEYISHSNQSKFVIAFNEFIVYGDEKNYMLAKEKFELCRKLNSKDLKKYLLFSVIIKDLAESDETIKEIINIA